jgi:hypothetical protein
MKNKYLISLRELRYIEVEADTEAEAEIKAFESDAWTTMVEEYVVSVVGTQDSQLILKLFEDDFKNDQ